MENQEKLATRRRKTKQKHNTVCVGDHYRLTNTNNVNKTWSLLQTTGGKLAAFYSNTCPLMLIAKMKIIITPSEQSFSNIMARTIYNLSAISWREQFTIFQQYHGENNLHFYKK